MDRFTRHARAATLALSLLAAVLLATVMLIWHVGRPDADLADGDIAEARGPNTPEENARNRIWTLFNSDCDSSGYDAASFETTLCRALHPGTGDETRLESLLALREMNAVRFDLDDAGRLVGILRDGPADIRIGLIRGMTADSGLGIRLSELTADFDRLRQFLWGEEVTLE